MESGKHLDSESLAEISDIEPRAKNAVADPLANLGLCAGALLQVVSDCSAAALLTVAERLPRSPSIWGSTIALLAKSQASTGAWVCAS